MNERIKGDRTTVKSPVDDRRDRSRTSEGGSVGEEQCRAQEPPVGLRRPPQGGEGFTEGPHVIQK